MSADLSRLVVRILATNTRKLLAIGAGALVTHGLAQPDEATRLAEELFGTLAGIASVIWGNVTQLWQAKLLMAAHDLPAGATPDQVRKRAGELAIGDLLSRVQQWMPSRAEIQALTESDREQSRQIEELHRLVATLRRGDQVAVPTTGGVAPLRLSDQPGMPPPGATWTR